MIQGHIPRIGFILRWKWAHSKQQALKLIRIELEKDPLYSKIVIPPLSIYCEVKEIPPSKP